MSRKVDVEGILGFKVPEEYKNRVNSSTHSGGFLYPGTKYVGPGNSLNKGEPVNHGDRVALKHDLEYDYYQYLYNKGEIDKKNFEEKIKESDSNFIKENSWFNLQEAISKVGIIGKKTVEKFTGQLYPSMHGEPSSKKSKLDNPEQEEEEEEEEIIRTQDSGFTGDMTLTGTGKEASSLESQTHGEGIVSIPRQMTEFGKKISTYRKVIDCISFAYASQTINITYRYGPTSTAPTRNAFIRNTCMAEIPWELPILYLTPSEFSALPNGAIAKECRVKVRFRSGVPQFQTSSSLSSIATLNNKIELWSAKGLIQTGWGQNIRIASTDTNQPMKPTQFGLPFYQKDTSSSPYLGLEDLLYGSNQSDSDMAANNTMACITGEEITLQNYFSLTTNDNIGEDVNIKKGGWPLFRNAVTSKSGNLQDAVIHTDVYRPKIGLLKEPIPFNNHAIPFPDHGYSNVIPMEIAIPNGVGVEPMLTKITSNEGTYVETELSSIKVAPDYTSAAQDDVTVNKLDLYSPIEKSQVYIKGNWNEIQKGCTQPSAHVGLRPIIALDPASSKAANINAWTSACAHWTIETEMDVEEHVPTRWAFGPPNVGYSEAHYKLDRYPEYNNDPRLISSTYGGLHPEKRTSIALN